MRAALLAALLAAPAGAAPEAVAFKTSDGWTIAGVYQAPKRGKPVAVLVHGVASGKGEWGRLTPELWKRGLGSLALDLRGHGESVQGPRGETFRAFDASGEWPRAERDLEAAIAYLKGRGLPESRIVLIGASIGANLASQAAAAHPKVPWAILLSPGQDYRGAAPAGLGKRPVLACASTPDAYAYDEALDLAAKQEGSVLLTAVKGHGEQMFGDPDFFKKLLFWIDKNTVKQVQRPLTQKSP